MFDHYGALTEPEIFAVLKRIELTTIDDPRSFYDEARYQGLCENCSNLGRPQRAVTFEAHHVLEAKHCKIYGAPRHSPDNALRLCAKRPTTCHERHTGHQELVELGALRDENVAFVVRWLGPGPAYNYLTRYYAGSDPRVDCLLR